MALPWKSLEKVQTPDGELELRRRGDDFLILIAGRVLMNSRANRSELALARFTCEALAAHGEAEAPLMLIGGLGMGCSARAALDAMPEGGRLVICEVNAVVARWCRGPLAAVNGDLLSDPRVTLEMQDVSRFIERWAGDRSLPRFDAIVLDLYEGPHAGTSARRDPFYGREALDRTRRALRRGGVFSVWSEAPDEGFEQRLTSTGFTCQRRRPGRGGLRHAVYVARSRR